MDISKLMGDIQKPHVSVLAQGAANSVLSLSASNSPTAFATLLTPEGQAAYIAAFNAIADGVERRLLADNQRAADEIGTGGHGHSR